MKKFFPYLAILLSIGFLLPQLSRGEIGNDNPTGPTGEYNGSITTAGSYDPFTGNSKRFVDDITVAGSVGAYPLKWTRVLNTRSGAAWTHSYQWGLIVTPYEYYHYYPDPYEGPGAVVNYPDGRTETFDEPQQPYTYDPNSMVQEAQDLLQHMGGGNFDLLMRDGGRVSFTHPTGSTSGSDLKATKITDPYGQITILTYDGSGRVSRVTEPGGRYLQITYTNGPSGVDNVQAFDGRGNLIETVSYNYTAITYGQFTNYYLTQANYDGGTHAFYTYQASNTGSTALGLVQTCDDVRFAGPMKKIEYEYQAAGGPYDVSWGQVKREKNATTHQVVSEISCPPYEPLGYTAAHFQRTETRSDGATRLFQYGSDGSGQLTSYTDFKGQTTQIAFPNTAPSGQYRKSVTDARGNTTSVDRDALVDVVRTITHPDGSTQLFIYTNGYYLASFTDELGHITSYVRDGKNRISDTTHPDGATEHFEYNLLGQVVLHRMASGGTETFGYDHGLTPLRGLKTSQTDPYGNVTTYNYYQSGPNTDRLLNVVDPRGNATWYEYNGRGEVTKLTHQDGSYVQSTYNPDGTVATVTDELGHTTSYTYDEYKRVLTVTNPLSQTTTNSYAPWSGIGSLSHTTASVYRATSPMGKMTDFNYDENFRRFVVHQGVGTPADDATTVSGFDAVGNLSWVQDPRNQTTYFGYDNRNRQTTITDALNKTTTTTYDYASNKTSITRPENPSSIQFLEHDPMNRLTHQIDETGVHTYMGYDHAGNLTSQTDGRGWVYSYGYDLLKRKTTMTCPDGSYEEFNYDAAGNMSARRNRQGVWQTFALYDNRNRATSFSWSDGTQGQSFEYDVASRVTALHNAEADIVNTYDAANRHTSETETIKSYGLYATRSTVSQYDADGNRSRVIFPQGYQFLYGYTQRNQLDNIKLDPAIFGGYYNTPLVQYVYDPSGNHTRRTLLSGAHAEYDIDELNRVRGQSDYFASGQMGRFDYAFDAMGRHRYEQRDWGTADGYQFDPRDQLTGYQRDGDLNMDGTVSAAFWNNTTLAYDNNGNRAQVTGVGADSYTVNNLNQYTNDTNTGTMLYDPKGNLTSAAGWTYGYDAQNRLTTMQGPGMTITQTYDPLNRVVTRNVNGAVTQNVWEGWNLIEEHRPDWSIQRCYLQGANQNEMVAAFDGGVYSNHWFWQDGRGNTSHITGDNAALLERYTYDLSGAPKFYDEWGNERWGGSVYDTRFLFAGSQYLPETGLYDMRNRFYSPALNRFLQTDPIGFAGDALNLYRYCGNDPVDRSDPTGLFAGIVSGDLRENWVDEDGFTQDARDQRKLSSAAGMDQGAGGGGKSISWKDEGGKINIAKSGNWGDQKSPDYYTDEQLNANGGRTGGVTIPNLKLKANPDGSVSGDMYVQSRLKREYKGTDVDRREQEHPDGFKTLYRSLSDNVFLKMARDKPMFGSHQEAAEYKRDVIQNLYDREVLRQKAWDQPHAWHDLNTYPPGP